MKKNLLFLIAVLFTFQAFSQTCIAPTNLSSLPSANNQIISWTAGEGETQWLLQYSVATDTSFANARTVDISSNPYSISDLNPMTTYNVRVKTICSASDSSAWSSNHSFTTACITISSLPWSESFDTYGNQVNETNPILPNCWTKISPHPYYTAYPTVSSRLYYSPPASLHFLSAFNAIVIGIIPRIDDSISMSDLRIKFKLRTPSYGNTFSIGVMTDPTNYNTFTQVSTASPSLLDIWEHFEVWFDSYAGSGKYIAFKLSNNSANNIFLDDLELSLIPSCLRPDSLVYNNLSSTTTYISWTPRGNENQWSLEFKPSLDTSWANAIVINNITTNHYTLVGLTSATGYDVRVKAICSSTDESEWSNMYFYTVITTLPLIESFEDYVLDDNDNNWDNVYAYPSSWTRLFNTSSPSPYIENTEYSCTGSLIFAAFSNQYNIAISPQFDTSIHIKILSAKFKVSKGNSDDKLYIGVMTNPKDSSSFVQIAEMMPNEIDVFEDFVIDFNSYTGNGQYIAFKSSSLSICLDDIEIYLPDCTTPSGINIINITATSATINFDNTVDREWELLYRAIDDTIWNIIVFDTSHYILNNLLPDADYEAVLLTLCNDSTYSDSSQVLSFRTSTLYLDSSFNNGTAYLCGKYVYDDGGEVNNHGSNYNYTFTLCPTRKPNEIGSVKRSSIYFEEFDLGQGDIMKAYSGGSINPQAQLSIGSVNNFTGNYLQNKTLVSNLLDTSGCITFNVISDASGEGTGFKAKVECVDRCQNTIAALDTFFIKYDALGNMSTHLIKDLVDSVYSSIDSSWTIVNYKSIDLCKDDSIVLIAKPQFPDNDVLYHQSLNTCIYNWNFGDNSRDTSYYSNTIGHKWERVKEYDLSLSVLDTNRYYINGKGCESNTSNTRIRIASNPIKTVSVLPEICSGQPFSFNIDYDTNSNVVLDSIKSMEKLSGRFDSTMFILDGNCVPHSCYEASIVFDEFPSDAVVSSADEIISICMNMEHSYLADLEFTIQCPSGESVKLKHFMHTGFVKLGEPTRYDYGCDPADNPQGIGWNYCFSNQYLDNPNGVLRANMPFPQDSGHVDSTRVFNRTGYFQTPFQNATSYLTGWELPDLNGFENFIGCPLNGEWTLKICDYWGSDNGFVFFWDIDLGQNSSWKYQAPIDTVIWDSPFVSPLSPTAYQITTPIDSSGMFKYDIHIVDDFGCVWDTVTFLNVAQSPILNLGQDSSSCSPFSIMLDAGNPNANSYLWLPTGDTTQTITANAIQDSTITYIAKVTNYNGSIYCFGIDSINLIVNSTPDAPINLAVQAITSSLEISWQGYAQTYEVYRNDNLLTISTQLTYIDSNLVDGETYCYKIKALNGDCESDFSNIVCKTYTGLEHIITNDLSVILYPNPTKDKTKLEIRGLKSNADVIVSDIYGRVIKTYKLMQTQNELEIDLKGFAKGIYNIKILNSDSNITKKLIIK